MNKRDRQLKSFELIFRMADIKGHEAAKQCQVVPMIVQQHKNMADDSSPVEKQWFVESGVCGFAWVTIRPANSTVGNFAKTQGWRHNSYSGGVELWVSAYGQSMQRKEAYAWAFAKELNANGIPASAGSRID